MDYRNNNKGYFQQEEAELPKGYLEDGYYYIKDKEKILDKNYIIKYPREIAKTFEKQGKRNVNKRSQIRKFYEYSLRIGEMVKGDDERFASYEAELCRLESFAEYAESRERVSALFTEFIRRNLEHINNAKDLAAFNKHFEAIIAYMPKERN